MNWRIWVNEPKVKQHCDNAKEAVNWRKLESPPTEVTPNKVEQGLEGWEGVWPRVEVGVGKGLAGEMSGRYKGKKA